MKNCQNISRLNAYHNALQTLQQAGKKLFPVVASNHRTYTASTCTQLSAISVASGLPPSGHLSFILSGVDMSFLDLSNEILLEIINYLQRTCTAILRCSRRLHGVAGPVLYSSVHLKYPKSYMRFIRTIVRNPDLTAYVRHFRTVGHPYGSDFDLSFLTLEDRSWVRNQLPDSIYGRSTCNKWFKQMFFSSIVSWLDVPIYWDAITAFLMTLFAARLATIRIDSCGWNADRYRYIEMVLKSTKSPSRFQHLEEVTLNPIDNHGTETPVHLIIPYMQVLSVTKFRASNVSLARVPSKLTFNVRDLTLDRCLLNGHSLRSFLLCFHSLKHIKYYHTGRDISTLVASDVCRGLANSKDILEDLVLVHIPSEVEAWSGNDSAPSDEDGELAASSGADIEVSKPEVVESLQLFTKLKFLQIESIFLLPSKSRRHSPQTNFDSLDSCRENDHTALVDCLPNSLERLTLNISPGTQCYVSQLLSRDMLNTNNSGLGSVHLLFRHSYTRDGKPMKPNIGRLEELRGLTREEGVDLSWNCMCGLLKPFQCYENFV
ncbi:hypothetical protein ONS95_013225 [Cadophora gregata]|uniref:uncharacterized protein n=1 Tax=Cadophora gregata TaxID=51156 RepID=UPI0026DD2DE5|nr:uncharacterized protein ONS95_013225 [Cadophora gregata]KAK0099953.1 hypothetical protein ONS96_007898 [Cadophora gregata f. sp. sojae]KAK0116195.1 hypothetical protein ONS95_013225 [Cadophora gregata]